MPRAGNRVTLAPDVRDHRLHPEVAHQHRVLPHQAVPLPGRLRNLGAGRVVLLVGALGLVAYELAYFVALVRLATRARLATSMTAEVLMARRVVVG